MNGDDDIDDLGEVTTKGKIVKKKDGDSTTNKKDKEKEKAEKEKKENKKSNNNGQIAPETGTGEKVDIEKSPQELAEEEEKRLAAFMDDEVSLFIDERFVVGSSVFFSFSLFLFFSILFVSCFIDLQLWCKCSILHDTHHKP